MWIGACFGSTTGFIGPKWYERGYEEKSASNPHGDWENAEYNVVRMYPSGET